MSVLATEDICLVSAADICPVSTADICPVSTEDIYPVIVADILGGDENNFDPFFTPKIIKMEFIRGCPGVPRGARRNGGRDVETEPHQQRAMARITAVKQAPSNEGALKAMNRTTVLLALSPAPGLGWAWPCH